MADLLFGKQTAEVVIVVKEWIGVTDRQNDLDLAQLLQLPATIKPRQEVRRSVEIDCTVVVAVEQIAEGSRP